MRNKHLINYIEALHLSQSIEGADQQVLKKQIDYKQRLQLSEKKIVI